MFLSRAFLAASLIAAATASTAEVWDYGEQECGDLWFSRNLIMHRAGYCFGSTLGKAVFDNAGCLGTNVAPPGEQSRQVRKIQALEAEIGCKVNTGQRRLDAPNMDGLRRLRDMPLPDNGGAACTWSGAPLSYHDGYSAGSQAIGQVRAGDRIGFGWIGEGDWSVIATGAPGVIGWVDFGSADFEKNCTDWAG